MKQCLRLQSAVVISSHAALSEDRIQPCGTSSESRRKDTDQCQHVAISFCRHRSVPVTCRKGSVKTTVTEGGQNPVAKLWGGTLWRQLTTRADFQLCLHRLLMSAGCKSTYSSYLDVSCRNGGLRISNWIGQLLCLTIFSTSLLVVYGSLLNFLRTAGGSMLESTGCHGRGVGRRLPEMSRMVEFNCT